MKKRVLFLAVCMSLFVLAAGCNTKEDKKEAGNPTPTVTGSPEDTEGSDTTADTEPQYLVNDLEKGEYNVDDYISLGKYKGVEVNVAPAEVTEDDIFFAIQTELDINGGAELKEVSGPTVRLGHTVNIDYEGLKDGVAFDGGTASGYNLMIGSGDFIPGFEDGIIGAKIGDKLDLDITFPENYSNADLAGQPVVFKITVNKIQEYELTEEYVTSNTEYASVEAYKAGIEESLLEEKIADRQLEIESTVYESILEDSKFSSLPPALLAYYKNDIKVYYSNVAMAYGTDFAGFLAASGVSEELFDQDSTRYAENMTKRDLIINAIIKAEGMELSEEEYDAKALAKAEEYGYESVEDFLSIADPAVLREEINMDMVLDFIVAEAIVK